MLQTEFASLVTCKVAAHLAQAMQAPQVVHNFTNNLQQQMSVIHNNNPGLSTLQVLAWMYAEDKRSDLFALAFEELQGPGKQLLGVNIQQVDDAPRVMSLIVGNAM